MQASLTVEEKESQEKHGLDLEQMRIVGGRSGDFRRLRGRICRRRGGTFCFLASGDSSLFELSAIGSRGDRARCDGMAEMERWGDCSRNLGTSNTALR